MLDSSWKATPQGRQQYTEMQDYFSLMGKCSKGDRVGEAVVSLNQR